MELKEIEKLAMEACLEAGVSLYDISFLNTKKGKVLAVFIIKMGGVSVEDCKKVSRRLEEILEENDLIKSRYFLEVSSPGIERPLRLKKHYLSAINENIKITFKDEEDKTKTIIGTLKEVNPQKIKIITEKNNDFEIKFRDIKKAKTHFNKF